MTLTTRMLSLVKLIFVGAYLVISCSITMASQLTQWRTAGSNAFEFVLSCESNLTYAIQASTNLTSWTTRARSKGAEITRRININFGSSNFPQRAFFRALQTNEPTFAFALAARETIDLGTNNTYVDSFDSSDANYSTAGYYDPLKRSDRGKIASESTIPNAIIVRDARVFGRVSTGSGGSVSVGPNGVVGDGFYVMNPLNVGQIQPNHVSNDAADIFDNVVLPADSGGWAAPPSPVPILFPDGTVQNTIVLIEGKYRSPTLRNHIYIVGNVRLRIDENLNMTGQDRLQLNTNATLTLYMHGTNATFAGRGICNPNRATNFTYFGTSRNAALHIGGNSEVAGVFYAPHADVILFAYDISGAVYAKSVRVAGPVGFHFDESLLTYGPWR